MAARRLYVDDAAARADLGYSSGPVRDALARAVAWYRRHGYLSDAGGA
jgi:hypothetical protein